jgi:DNA-binding IclR family transcriptional regulator
MDPPDDGIKPVGTTVRVLEALSDGGTLGVTELAGRLGLPKSTVYSHLRTLEAHGYAVAGDGTYQLSPGFLEYGKRVQRSRRVFESARPELDGIRDRGYAFDRGERAENLRCVAAPIVVAGDLEGAISVTGPLPRMRGERFEEVLPTRVVDTASVIEIDMTYS